MKRKTLALFAFIVFTPFLQAHGQNLGFELASIVPVGGGAPPFLVVASDALPGWTAYIGSSPIDSIFYNTISAGSPIVSIHDSASPIFQPLQGNYSVALQHSGGGQAGHSSDRPNQVAAFEYPFTHFFCGLVNFFAV